jgi:S1-C subfamily serine protease
MEERLMKLVHGVLLLALLLGAPEARSQQAPAEAASAPVDATLPVRLHVDKLEVEVRMPAEPPKEAGGKDAWDKFAAISTFLSGIVVALVGIVATAVYNARQQASQDQQKTHELAVQRVQTVESLLPHLASSDPKLRLGALDAIAALGDEALATKLAQRFGGEGGAEALAGLTRSSDPQVAYTAVAALAQLFTALQPSVFIFESGEHAEASATGFFVSASGLALIPEFALARQPYHARFERGGPAYPVELVRTNALVHLALVQVAVPAPVRPVAIGEPEVEIGQQVIALGYAPGKPWVSVAGRITGQGGGMLHADLSLEPGMAGAPVVNSKSELVGMAIGSGPERTFSFLVPAGVIAEFMQG